MSFHFFWLKQKNEAKFQSFLFRKALTEYFGRNIVRASARSPKKAPLNLRSLMKIASLAQLSAHFPVRKRRSTRAREIFLALTLRSFEMFSAQN